MRVIHVLKHCNRGHGNAHVAVDLACAQAAHGDDVVYASGGGDFEALMTRCGVELYKLPHDQNHVGTMVSAVARLAKLCRTFRPDVIHAHMMGAALIGYSNGLLTGVPMVTTVHNSFDRHSVFMRLGHRVVAVSEAERRQLVARHFNPDRLDVVLNGPNGSARESDVGAEQAPALRTPCITTICGLHARKGVKDVLLAFAAFQSDNPEWSLNVVGDGPDRGALESMARDLGIDGRVNFTGSITNPRSILEQSDIFVLASYAEPCSLAVAEARASGCAIVATAVGGTPELLAHGAAGRLVEPGAPNDLAREFAFLSIRDNLAEWRRRARTGSDYLTINRVSHDYRAVYAKLIGRQVPRAAGLSSAARRL